jgi:2-dehydro-3-deoxyphosphogluconate aldolase / (4S)-4-hydroxy-2-oxoglutarate aldolase
MNRKAVRNCLTQIGIIPAIRLSSAEDASFAIEAVSDSGIPAAEVTLTVPNALEVISDLARQRPELIIGAGTVVDLEAARRSIDAGAVFLSSPGLDLEIVEFAHKQSVAVVPGALTPSEIMAAWKAGADLIKVYPCSLLGGTNYIRTLRLPFPNVPLIAAGGVTQQTAADFILAGADALGIGRDLINSEAVQRREIQWIRELSKRFLQIVRDARAQTGVTLPRPE